MAESGYVLYIHNSADKWRVAVIPTPPLRERAEKVYVAKTLQGAVGMAYKDWEDG